MGKVGKPTGEMRTVGAGIVPGSATDARSGMVGAGVIPDDIPGDIAGAPTAGRSGTVGGAVSGRGAPPGTGGLTGGAMGIVADGLAGGASDAFNVIRTVSFFSGTLDVCLDGAVGWFSFSLMRSDVVSSI